MWETAPPTGEFKRLLCAEDVCFSSLVSPDFYQGFRLIYISNEKTTTTTTTTWERRRGAAVTACWRRHISLIFPSLTGRSRPRNNNNTNTQSDGMYLQRRPVCRTPSVNAASGGGEEEEEEEEREGLFGGFGG